MTHFTAGKVKKTLKISPLNKRTRPVGEGKEAGQDTLANLEGLEPSEVRDATGDVGVR